MRYTACAVAIMLLFVSAGFPPAGYAQEAAPAVATTDPKYNPATEATMKGIIGEIKEITLAGAAHVDLVMKSATEEFEVGVCPPDIFKDLIVKFAAGDEVEVIGSKVQRGEKVFVMAREITKGNQKVALRDKKGSPVWMWMRE